MRMHYWMESEGCARTALDGFRALLVASVGLALLAASANAATIVIPSTTVVSTATFPGQLGVSTAGPTITLTNDLAPTDTLTLDAVGEVFLQGSGTYGTNAAGVVTTAGSTGVGDTSLNSSLPGTNFGALLLGNSTFGFHQLFPANAANGLGSAIPPSFLSLSGVSLSDLGFGSTLPSGTVLQFMISDTLTIDNFGNFSVSGHFGTVAASVPAPATLLLLGSGLAALAGTRLTRKRK